MIFCNKTRLLEGFQAGFVRRIVSGADGLTTAKASGKRAGMDERSMKRIGKRAERRGIQPACLGESSPARRYFSYAYVGEILLR